jgi:phospholipase/lecithinase/hemolysin
MMPCHDGTWVSLMKEPSRYTQESHNATRSSTWWDDVHPTTSVVKMISKQEVTEPGIAALCCENDSMTQRLNESLSL